jgi:hypothetical protein
MNRYPTERWVVIIAIGLAAVLAMLLIGTLIVTDAPLDPFNQGDAGTSRLADASGGAVASAYTAAGAETAPETVIVIGGGGELTSADVAALNNHLYDGGQVVVLTEDKQSNQLLAALDAETRVAVGYLHTTAQQSVNPEQFVVSGGGDTEPTLSGVQINAAKPLGVADSGDSTNRTILAWSAPAGRDLNSDGQISDTEPRGIYPVAVAEPVGAGRIVVVGDASVLTNGQWKVEENRQFTRTITGDGALLIYPQWNSFPLVSQFRFGLNTPPGTLLGLAVFCGGGATGAWLGVWVYRRRDTTATEDTRLTITLR